MITTKEVEELIKEQLSKQYIFKKKELSYFIPLLKDKLSGTWLIRESRVKGMITVTCKTEESLQHCRYAYQPDNNPKWQIVPGNNVTEASITAPYQQVFNDTMAEASEGFLRLIQQELNLTMNNLMLPNDNENTSQYSSYVIRESDYIMVDEPRKSFIAPQTALEMLEQRILNLLAPCHTDEILAFFINSKRLSTKSLIHYLQLPETDSNQHIAAKILSKKLSLQKAQ